MKRIIIIMTILILVLFLSIFVSKNIRSTYKEDTYAKETSDLQTKVSMRQMEIYNIYIIGTSGIDSVSKVLYEIEKEKIERYQRIEIRKLKIKHNK